MESKKGFISPLQFYSMVFLMRAMTLLSARGSLSFLNLFISFTLSLILCFIMINVKKINRKIIFVLCIITAGIETERFFAFMKLEKENELSLFLIFSLIALSVLYASKLGVQALLRFSFLCAVLVIITAFGIFFENAFEMTFDNIKQSNFSFLTGRQNIADILLCFDFFAVYFSLKDTFVTEKKTKFLLPVFASYGISGLIYFVCFGVTGNASNLYNYNILKLFQLGRAGTFLRLDAIYIAIWLIVLFLKVSVLFCCAERSLKNE